MTKSYVILIMIIKNLVSYDYNIMNIWLVIMKITKLSKYMGRLSKLS